MTALQEHVAAQAGRALMLSRIMDLLNIAIDHPDRRDLCIQLIEAGQEVASDLEGKLQDVNLPKGGAQ